MLYIQYILPISHAIHIQYILPISHAVHIQYILPISHALHIQYILPIPHAVYTIYPSYFIYIHINRVHIYLLVSYSYCIHLRAVQCTGYTCVNIWVRLLTQKKNIYSECKLDDLKKNNDNL